MNIIIAIYGHGKCGKTTTLNYVRDLIRGCGGISLSSKPPYSGDKPETFKYNGKTVCVCPGGDTGTVVQNNFIYAYSKNADIIITASRSRGDSVAVVKSEATKCGISVEWYQKSYEYCLSKRTQELCNKEFAQLIFASL